MLRFELAEPVHEPVVLGVGGDGLIEHVVGVVHSLDLPPQLVNLALDARYFAFGFDHWPRAHFLCCRVLGVQLGT